MSQLEFFFSISPHREMIPLNLDVKGKKKKEEKNHISISIAAIS